MINEKDTLQSIMRELTPDDFDLLMEDVRLQQAGVEIRFVVDSYDIIEYCFPQGPRKEKKINQESLDRISEEQLAYYFIFRREQKHPILLNEYKPELNNNHEIAKSNYLDGDDGFLRSCLEGLIKTYELNNSFNNEVESSDETTEGTTLIDGSLKESYANVSFMLGALMNNLSPHRFFDYLLENKILHSKEQQIFNDQPDEQFLADLFSKSQYDSKWCTAAFNEWYRTHLLSKSSKGLLQGFANIESALRDLMVIQRIIKANINCNDEKKLFLYFSSAEKTEKLLNNSKVRELCNNHWYLKDEKHTIQRSTKHAYLLCLAQAVDTLDYEKVLTNLESLKDFVVKYRKRVVTSNDLQQLTMPTFQELENHLLGRSFFIQNKGFEEEVKKLKAKQTPTRGEQLIIKKYDALKETVQVHHDSDTKLYGITLDFQLSIKDVIDHLTKEIPKRGELWFGHDHVRGSYHHLPILIGYRSNMRRENEYYNLLANAAIYYTRDYKEIGEQEDDLKNAILQFREKVFGQSHRNILLEKITNLFLLLATTDRDKPDERWSKERLDNYFEFLEIIYKAQNTQFYKTDDGRIVPITKELRYDNLYSELLYVKAWLYRKLKCYDESENISKEGDSLEFYDPEPRFKHNLALIAFCRYMEGRKLDISDFSLINVFEKHCNEALKLYKFQYDRTESRLKFLEKAIGERPKQEADFQQLLGGTRMSLLNMKKYLLACKLGTQLINGEAPDTTIVKKIDLNDKYILNFLKKYRFNESHYFELKLADSIYKVVHLAYDMELNGRSDSTRNNFYNQALEVNERLEELIKSKVPTRTLYYEKDILMIEKLLDSYGV